MKLTFSSTFYVPRQAPRGKVAFYDTRQHEPLDKMYAKMVVPPLEAILMPPGAVFLGEAREQDGDWSLPGHFKMTPNLVESGLVIQPLPWMPGFCFQMVNLASWAQQLWPGTTFGEFHTVEAGYRG